jgi:hypothetical protein
MARSSSISPCLGADTAHLCKQAYSETFSTSLDHDDDGAAAIALGEPSPSRIAGGMSKMRE